MGQPIRTSHAAIRSYTDQLQALWKDLTLDKIDEAKSLALVAHIVNNRPAAESALRALEQQSAGLPC